MINWRNSKESNSTFFLNCCGQMEIFKAIAFQGWVTQILLVLAFTENTPMDDSQSICFFCCTVAKQTFPLFSILKPMFISAPTSFTPLQFIKIILNSSPALVQLRVFCRITEYPFHPSIWMHSNTRSAGDRAQQKAYQQVHFKKLISKFIATCVGSNHYKEWSLHTIKWSKSTVKNNLLHKISTVNNLMFRDKGLQTCLIWANIFWAFSFHRSQDTATLVSHRKHSPGE